MARPFRLHPPALPGTTLARPRLLELLARRFERRLTTVVAGPGFGKTVLLVAAIAETAPATRDVWLACEPADASAEHLTTGIAEALGLPADSDLDLVLDAVWSRAPEPICLVVDDVHEVPVDSDGATLLERLVTDLPRNGHLLLASRDAVPVRTARLAATGDLMRVTEDDLTFDAAELAAFAVARGVEPELLASTGGWPALAELTASAGEDLVIDYLWEEVLTRMGAERSEVLARLAVVGTADDEVATALAGRPTRVDDLLAGVPLVARSETAEVSLHPLWAPALRRHLSHRDALAARRRAAAVHRARGRVTTAVELLAEAEAWDELLAVLRDTAMHLLTTIPAAELGRWVGMLPAAWRDRPEAVLAAGLERQGRAPLEAVDLFAAAREGFRATGDVDAEVAAVTQEGLVRWWTNDVPALVELVARCEELAARGSQRAAVLVAVGNASVAHLAGDSDRVRDLLEGVDEHLPAGWAAVVHWLRSVAHRRDGDLASSRRELEAAEAVTVEGFRLELRRAARRTAWLEGRIDEASEQLTVQQTDYEGSGKHYLEREALFELARTAAWLGDPNTARDWLARATTLVPEMESPLVRTLRLIADAAVAVAEDDEGRAADILRDAVGSALGGPDAWYWRDRAAIALTHVLVPSTRDAWSGEPLGVAHRPAIALADALEAERDGDLSPVRALEWPDPGVVQAHLPLPWVVELVAAGAAAGNPAPEELLRALGPHLRPMLRTVAARRPHVATAAQRLAAAVPAEAGHRLGIDLLGPLVVRHDGTPIVHAELRRRRVRELLCTVVAHRRLRREAVAAELWPDLDDGGRNLRVTLTYLQRALQPDRDPDEPPYFLRSDGTFLELTGEDRLEVDAWELDTQLDSADVADRAGAPKRALAAYLAALPLWRGEPYADAPDAAWVHAERARLQRRYVSAALRAGELLLASGAIAEAREAAERAIFADQAAEPAYQLLVRAHLADGDRAGARRALASCRAALAELDVEPDPATVALLDDG